MWKYFARINIDALVDITKRKRTDADHHRNKDEPTAFADIRKRWGNHRKSIKNRMKKFYTKDDQSSGGFSSSCKKDSPSAAASSAAAVNRCSSSLSDDDLGSQGASCSTTSSSDSGRSTDLTSFEKGFVMNEIDKYRKGEKHIFGSLGRLRKSRTSLCLEEMSPKKKLIVSESSLVPTTTPPPPSSSSSSSSSSGRGKQQKKQPDFQQELKLKVNRRCANSVVK